MLCLFRLNQQKCRVWETTVARWLGYN